MESQKFTMNLQEAMQTLGRRLNPDQVTEAAKVDALRDISFALAVIAEVMTRQYPQDEHEDHEQGHTSLSDQ